ncbi:MAG: ATP-binding protein [Anaerolineales bacterium]|nr:ATP-binding protein [Anaerolineales bacterium]
MNKTDFRGRVTELMLLDRLWHTNSASLLILYGRRRVGKTRLLTHWMQQDAHRDRSIYWVAEPSSALHQLRSFSQTIFNFGHPGSHAPQDFTYASWEQAFEEVARLAKDERLALFVDEFTYLIESDSDIVGKLQKVWDHTLKNSNLFLALSGSQMGLMQREMLSYQAPLYGRATAQLELPPMPFTVTREFFPEYATDEHVAIYAILGGVPAYWERLDAAQPLLVNVQNQLFTPNTLMQEEPKLLLQDFITDTHNYHGIIRAIAHGALTQHAISKHTGLSQGHISKYLSVLRGTGFVERRVPVTEASGRSRRGHYYVTDPYLRFYYRFLAANRMQLAVWSPQQVMTYIEENLGPFIGQNTWPELCRQWLLAAGIYDERVPVLEEIGGAWTRKQIVEVAGINRASSIMALGVCHWEDDPISHHSLRELINQTNAIVPKTGTWRVYYYGFSRKGWTEEAETLARAIRQIGESGKNWSAADLYLLDLEQINRDLVRWSVPMN